MRVCLLSDEQCDEAEWEIEGESGTESEKAREGGREKCRGEGRGGSLVMLPVAEEEDVALSALVHAPPARARVPSRGCLLYPAQIRPPGGLKLLTGDSDDGAPPGSPAAARGSGTAACAAGCAWQGAGRPMFRPPLGGTRSEGGGGAEGRQAGRMISPQIRYEN